MAKNIFMIRASYALLTTTILASVVHAETVSAEKPPHDEKLEEIVVSGAYEGRKLGETIQSASVLRQDEIARRLDGSLGETLKHQPGISSTFFGPGASRPVIRGLGGDRIRVLDSSLGSIDASSTSPDHAVSVEPALAERIEILRGTAMLMYGSAASGGVVNVFDGRIPSDVPENGIEGAARYGHATVDNSDEATIAVNALAGTFGDTSLVLHGDYSYRDADNYSIPGYSESAALRALEEGAGDALNEHETEAYGTVENSAATSKSGSAGASLVFPNGFIGMNVKVLDSQYGVPGGHAHEGGDMAGDAPVTIDLDQTRVDMRGELETDFAWFKKAKVRFGYADYRHAEIEGTETGTVFNNEGFEGRLDLIEKGGDSWSGATGFQVRRRDFSAIGEEAFVPATIGTQYGIYSVKEIDLDHWMLEFGGRFEHTDYSANELGISKNFNGISLSAGVGHDLSEASFVGLTVFRTERAPSTEELFSNGPHLATNAYELGDETLGLETALGIEATFNYDAGPLTFVLNGFLTSYSDFVYEAATGDEEDGLPVFKFTAADATFYGFEAKAEFHAGTIESKAFGDIDVHLDAQADYVRAKLRNVADDVDLPRIPPMSALMGIEASTASVDVRTELEYSASQKRIAAFELPTDDYLMWNAYLTVRPFENKNIALELKGTNLGNVEARQHTSFLKDMVPLPGRNVKLSVRASF